MSASRRLAKLKRSSMVSDVGLSSNTIQSLNNNVDNTSDSTLVKPVTILTWHEQRLNKMDNEMEDMKQAINPELIVSLVETIEQMEKKLTLLSDAYENILNEATKDIVSKEIKNKSPNTMKLNIVENE